MEVRPNFQPTTSLLVGEGKQQGVVTLRIIKGKRKIKIKKSEKLQTLENLFIGFVL